MLKTFLVGALSYPCLELLYRGRTHYSMALAGGVSTCILSKTNQLPTNIMTKSLIGGLGITCVEYLVGKIWNREYQVWDYRKTPLNYRGQICLPYSLLWCVLSSAVFLVMQQPQEKAGGRIQS